MISSSRHSINISPHESSKIVVELNFPSKYFLSFYNLIVGKTHSYQMSSSIPKFSFSFSFIFNLFINYFGLFNFKPPSNKRVLMSCKEQRLLEYHHIL